MGKPLLVYNNAFVFKEWPTNFESIFQVPLSCMWENFDGVLLKYWRTNQLEGKGFYKGIIGGQIGKQLFIHRICQFFLLQIFPTYVWYKFDS